MVELSGEGAIEVLQALGEIPDPEIPVISLVELGVVRRIDCSQGRVRVELTPTYSGCPAMHLMEQQVHDKLADLGYSEIEVRKVYSQLGARIGSIRMPKRNLEITGLLHLDQRV